uniref:Uncharacterized protein MANES_04G084000 n=1 Tax=Rhizophora mucronata TaxID=61149 RepID=A0A2P2KIL9_RHIMU
MEKADMEEDGETNEMEMADVAEEGDKEEVAKLAGTGEEMEMAEEAEKANEAEEIEMAEGIEGADEEVEDVDTNASGTGKRKRGKNVKSHAKVPSKKKMEEDVCFICFDGGNLVLCDRRGCPKAYHPACVNRDEAFFRAKGRWNCGWHLCSCCGKNAYYMCYTCTFSLCKGCTKDAVIYCVRGNKGFCETCMRTVTLIERNELGSREMGQVDFDDKGSWEYLFKDYWIDLKEQLSLTSEELAQAKNPWKGPDFHAGKQESLLELYDAHNDGGSGSDSSENAEVTTSKKRKPKKRMKSRAREADSRSVATGNVTEWATKNESIQWASKELLEFVMHMKNGDKSVCSQFDVQALLLEYIKQKKLRDPRRKSQIICDSRLERLFGKPRVGHFEMLKLLESHFLLKEDSRADDLPGSVVDTEANQLEADENFDTVIKPSKDRRRKSRKRGDGRGLRSNLDDYAAIDMHNINLIYLKRSLVENLIEDAETFHDKVVGAFVRIRISGNAQKQDLYRLVQVLGTTKAAAPYRVGKRMTDFLFEILNLNKTEVVTIDIISNQEFTEDECKRLRQSIKCGLINCLTVGDIQEKAMALQAVRVEDSLETEITRLSHLRDRASDLGRRKELRECVEKLQLLKSPEERQRRLDEIPEIHADPHMDPSYESEEDEGDAVDKRHENYMRPRGSNFGRRGLEPISPRKGGFASNDSWSVTRNYSSMSRDLSRSISGKGFLQNMEDVRTGELVNEKLLSQGGDNEAHQTQNWEKQKSSPDSESCGTQSAIKSEAAPNPMLEISPSPLSAKSAQSGVKVNETEKIWHYKDPSGKIQGPFSMLQLRKWSNTGYFPADLRIWRINEKQEDSILLTDALNGNFQKEPPTVDNSFPKAQLIHGPHFSSLSKESWKPQSEMGNSTVTDSAAPLEVTNNSGDGWASEVNLPSPTPVQTTLGGTKRQAHQSRWSPATIQPTASLLEANPFSRGSEEFSHTSVPSPSSPKLTGHANGTNMSHGVSLVPKPEAGILLGNANVPQIRSQPTVPDSPRQVNSNMVPATSRSGASINAAIDVKSLQKLVQPVTTSTPVGAHAWVSGLVSKTEMNTTNVIPGSGSHAWGIAPSQKLEPTNSMSMSTQPSVYGNWGEAPTSIHNSASSLNTGNQTGVSPGPGTSSFMPSDTWRTPVPGQSNLQPTVQSNVPWGMGSTGNQNPTQRQGPESQNPGWGTLSGNLNMGWGGFVPANSNLSWVAPQGQAPGNPNPVWAVPVQGQGSGNANAGRAAPMQGHAAGNSITSWVPPGQGPAPVNASTSWAAPGHGPTPGNVKPSWVAPSGNMGAWQAERDQNVDRTSSQRDGGSQGADSGYSAAKSWNRQSSFNRGGEPSRPPFKGQRVCKFHENGHCKKGASCDYLHT